MLDGDKRLAAVAGVVDDAAASGRGLVEGWVAGCVEGDSFFDKERNSFA
jgi:hypothetical protein